MGLSQLGLGASFSFRFEFTGGEIASAICTAAELAAGQEGGGASISHGNLLAAADKVWNRKQLNISPAMSIFQ